MPLDDEQEKEIEQATIAMPEPAPQPEAMEETEDDEVSDLFRVEREDVSDVADVSEETEVSEEDVMGQDDADMTDDVLETPKEEIEVSPGDVVGKGDADMTDDVLEVPKEEDMSDLFEVGGVTESRPKKVKPKRSRKTPKYYEPIEGGMRGIR